MTITPSTLRCVLFKQTKSMKKPYQPLFLFVSLFLLLSSAYAQDYYVSALTGLDTNDGLTPGTPLATIQQGADRVNPGGTVFIMNGTYSRTAGPVLHFTRPGTPGGYITFKPFPGHSPVVTATGGAWNAVVVDGSYVVIEGLELEGRNADLTLAGAEESYRQSRQTPAVFNARYNTNGIAMATVPNINPHHIIIRNCKVHDFPGGGINVGNGAGAGATAAGPDYVTVENNEVYNNCWYTMYATSGISVIGPKPVDNVTGYKIIIRGNRCYNNFTQVKWRRSNPALDALSDGNGIILDVNNGSQNRPVYTGRTLVENNVSYHNGGGGIHAFQAARVDIFNNTAYHNGKVVGYPEIDGQSGSDVRIYNNIMYARTGGACNLNDAGAVYNHNVYYNGSYFRAGPDDVVADPLFVRPGLDAGADFRLQAGSPALNTGNGADGFFSAQDITGLARPQGGKPERGAYEFPSGSQNQAITFAELPGLTTGDADYLPQATASSGLPVHYASSNPEVAVIFNGRIQAVGGGTTTITAGQGGDGTYAAAAEVSRPLVVDGTGYGPLPVNGTFEGGTEGWSTFARVPGSIAIAAVPRTSYRGNALEATVPAVASPGSFDLQVMHAMPLVAGRTYTIRFRASTATAAPVDVILQSNQTTNRSFFAIRITAVPTDYTVAYTATATDAANFLKFMVGKCTAPLYLDDVVITAAPAPVMTIRQGETVIADNTATGTASSYDFGAVPFGSAAKVTFSIGNTGARTLNLLYAQKISVTGPGFSLATNVPAPTVAPGGKVTFEVEFRPDSSGTFTGNLTIANNDPALNKNPYNFILKATAPKAGQTLTFADAPALAYGDAGQALAATATSGLPVTYAVLSGPGVITGGNVLSPTGAGDIVVEATQAGNHNYNAAPPVQRTVTVARKDLLVTAADQTVTYGDPVPAYTYTLTGFVFGQTAADIAGSPVLRSAYTPATPATESPAIVVETGSLSAPNYNFVPANGKITIRHTFPLFLEAEKAAIRGGNVVAVFPGFTGSGYVDHLGKEADFIQWTANASGAGMCRLTFRYALNNPSQGLTLTVNGTVVPAAVPFAKSGNWNAWETVSAGAYLKAGPNTIRLNGSGIAGPSIDHLLVESDLYAAGARTASPASGQKAGPASDTRAGLGVYPVPARDQVRVTVAARRGAAVTISLVDGQGRTHQSTLHRAARDGSNTIAVDVTTARSGAYVLRATTAEGSQSKVILIAK